jgi:hypothetical protein
MTPLEQAKIALDQAIVDVLSGLADPQMLRDALAEYERLGGWEGEQREQLSQG